MSDEIRVPTVEEINLLVETAKAEPLDGSATEAFPQAIIFAAYTGVRLGELLALEWVDVDGDELQVTKQRRRDGGTAPPKNNSSGTILIPAPAIEALDAAEPVGARRGRDRIFDYSRREHTRVWGRVRDVTAINHLRWHDLRHFCATWWIDQGASDLDVSIQLRHKDGGELVRRRYGHPSPQKARDRLRAIASREALAGALS